MSGLLEATKPAGLLSTVPSSGPSFSGDTPQITNQNFSMGGQSTPAWAAPDTPNIDPVEIFNNILPGVKPLMQSLIQRSFTPERQYFASLAKKQDIGLYTIDGKRVGTDYGKMSKLASDLVLGSVGGGEANWAKSVEEIAASKSKAEIAPILERLGVQKEFVGPGARLFATIDDPKMVSHLLNSTFKVRPAGLLNASENSLEMTKLNLENKKNIIDNSPFNHPDNRLMVDKEGRVRELGDIKSPTLIRKIEDRMAESGIKDPAEFSAGIEDYFKQKNELVKLQKDFKTSVTKPIYLKRSAEGLPLALSERQKAIVRASSDANLNSLETRPNIQLPQRSGNLEDSNQGTSLRLPRSEGEAKSIEIQARQALSSMSGEEIPSGVSFPKIIEQTVTHVQKKVNTIDTYLRTPDRVLNKIGFGTEAKELRGAMDAYWKELPKNLDKITQWSKRVSPTSNQRIFKYLDGQAITLTDPERRVAFEVKNWLSTWKDRLGLKSDNTISEYITHIFDKDSQKEFDEQLAKVISDKIPGSVYDPFTMKRLGARGYVQDTWRALDAYVKRATRKVHLDPVLEKIQGKAGSQLEFTNLEKSQYKYIERYINNVNMRPSEFDEGIDNAIKSIVGYKFGQRPVTALTRVLRRMTFRGMLGLNVGSALRNISQGINTYAVLGEKYTTLGYASLFKKGAMAELDAEGVFNAGFVQDKILSSTEKIMAKVDKVLFSFFNTAERINRGAAYFGAKAKFINAMEKQGKTHSINVEDKAIEYAKGIVRKTQFSFDSIDTPVGMQSDIAKTLLQFQSYTTKQAEFLIEMAHDKNFIGLLRYAIAGLAFVYTIGKSFGMKPQELIPIYRLGVPPSLQLPTAVGSAAVNAPDVYGNQRSLLQKGKDIVKTAIPLVPAGNQLKKSYQGYEAVKQGKSTDAAGRAQFKVGGTPASDAQAILFGKYANSNAQNYFNGDTYAEQEYKKLLASPTAKADFDNIIKNDPALAQNILKVKEKIDLGITPADEKILNMGVVNGARAKYIAGKLNALKTNDAKAKLWDEYVNKKIVTKEVSVQLKGLLKK